MNVIKPNANELSTYAVKVTVRDENGNLATPTDLSWTLKDLAGTVVNDREDEEIYAPGSVSYITLTGNDLAIDGYFSARRVLTVTGHYDSSLGEGLPLAAGCILDIDRLAATPSSDGDGSLLRMINRLTPYFGGDPMTKCPPALRVALLNEAQKKVIPLIPRHMLTVLDVSLGECVLDESGAFDLASLTNPVYHGNTFIDGLQISTGKYAVRKSFDERRNDINGNVHHTTYDPIYWIRGSKVYVEPGAEGDTITLHYKRMPLEMAYSDDPTLIVDCEFSGDIVDIIVELAAWWGLQFIFKEEKLAKAARERAEADIMTITSTGPDNIDSASVRNVFDSFEETGYFPVFMNIDTSGT